MKKINNGADLKKIIASLEMKQAQDGELLKQEMTNVYASLHPINIIKTTLKELAVTTLGKNNELFDTSLSLAAGYLSKKIISGSHDSKVKKLFSNLLEIGIINLVHHNIEDIKYFTIGLLNTIIEKNTPARR